MMTCRPSSTNSTANSNTGVPKNAPSDFRFPSSTKGHLNPNIRN